MFRPNASRNVQLEARVTPSGVSMPVNSEGNRNAVAAAYAADGDPTMTTVMCGFWLQAAVLDVSTKTFADVKTVSHLLRSTFGMEMHYAMAAAMRMKSEDPKVFKRIADGL